MNVDGLGPTADGMEEYFMGLVLEISYYFLDRAILKIIIDCTVTYSLCLLLDVLSPFFLKICHCLHGSVVS